MRIARPNFDAIESSLRCVQRRFDLINQNLGAERVPLYDDVLINMLEGYKLLDKYLVDRIDLFAPGNSHHILELNNVVLFNQDQQSRDDYEKQLVQSERHFYDRPSAGIGGFIDFCERQDKKNPYHLAATIYIYLLAQPQLFIEGNHRTGALLMSYVLLRHSLPPFVLTPLNAPDIFEPTTEIGKLHKKGILMWLGFPRLRKHFIQVLHDSEDYRYLLDESVLYER